MAGVFLMQTGSLKTRLASELRSVGGVLWLVAVPTVLFGMPLLYAATDSYMTQSHMGESKPNKATPAVVPKQEENSLHVDSSVKSSTKSSTSSTNISASTNAANPQNTVHMSINGQTVPVPQSGSVHKQFSSKDGSTVVDVRVDGAGNSQSTTSSTSIQINSQSYSSGSETNGAEGRHPTRR